MSGLTEPSIFDDRSKLPPLPVLVSIFIPISLIQSMCSEISLKQDLCIWH